MKVSINQEPNLIQRIAGGSVVLAFACVPIYVGGMLLVRVITSHEPLNIDILIAIAVSILIAAPFLLLSYRIFTGRGRKKDDGLVSPYVLFILSLIFTGIGILIIFINPENDILMSLFGGISFIFTGAGGIVLSLRRMQR